MPELGAEILAEIRRVVAAELELTHPVELDSELASDLKLDSIGALVIAVSLEDRFRVKLTGDDAGNLLTVRDVVELVERRIREDGERPDPEPQPDGGER